MDAETRRARDGEPGNYRIGGSEAAAALGWSEWESPLALYLRKRGETPLDDTDNDAARAGRFLEDGILKLYAEVTGRRVVLPTEMRERRIPELASFWDAVTVVHVDPLVIVPKSRPWATISLDGLTLHPEWGWGPLDAKNVSERKRCDWSDPEDRSPIVPPQYTAQIVHYAAPLPFKWGGFATLFGGNDLHAFDVSPEQVAEVDAVTAPRCEAFVARMNEGRPPPVQPSESDRAALLALFGERARPAPPKAWHSPYKTAHHEFDPETFHEAYQGAREAANDAWDKRKHLEAVLLAVADGSRSVRLPCGTTYSISRDRAGRVRFTHKAPR